MPRRGGRGADVGVRATGDCMCDECGEGCTVPAIGCGRTAVHCTAVDHSCRTELADVAFTMLMGTHGVLPGTHGYSGSQQCRTELADVAFTMLMGVAALRDDLKSLPRPSITVPYRHEVAAAAFTSAPHATCQHKLPVKVVVGDQTARSYSRHGPHRHTARSQIVHTSYTFAHVPYSVHCRRSCWRVFGMASRPSLRSPSWP